jgi:hypothetical protein
MACACAIAWVTFHTACTSNRTGTIDRLVVIGSSAEELEVQPSIKYPPDMTFLTLVGVELVKGTLLPVFLRNFCAGLGHRPRWIFFQLLLRLGERNLCERETRPVCGEIDLHVGPFISFLASPINNPEQLFLILHCRHSLLSLPAQLVDDAVARGILFDFFEFVGSNIGV